MISLKWVKQYCKNYEQIENYQEAISSPERWDCHHRNEIDMNLSTEELKERNLYYNRPASELIFLTHGDHTKIHKMGNKYGIGNKSRTGRRHTEEARKKISESIKGISRSKETKKKISESKKKFICPIKLTYMYCKQEMSAHAIAKEFGVDGNVIRRRLRELNIPIRK